MFRKFLKGAPDLQQGTKKGTIKLELQPWKTSYQQKGYLCTNKVVVVVVVVVVGIKQTDDKHMNNIPVGVPKGVMFSRNVSTYK